MIKLKAYKTEYWKHMSMQEGDYTTTKSLGAERQQAQSAKTVRATV